MTDSKEEFMVNVRKRGVEAKEAGADIKAVSKD